MTLGEIATVFGVVTKAGEWIAKGAARVFRRPDTVAILKRRQELRDEFLKRMPLPDDYGICGEAIIRDIRRFDSYPDLGRPQKGKFPWFQVEIKGLYHRGIETFIGLPRAIRKDMYGEWKFTKIRDEETVTGYLAGRIPFDRIVHIDWNGDERNPYPHIFCRYNRFREHPYETIAVFKKIGNSENVEEVKPFRKKDLKNIF